jgi:hypothetical protein
VGRGQANEAAVRDGQHGTHGAIKLVGNAGGLIDDEQMDIGEAANGVGLAGETDDAAGVFEADLVLGAALQERRADAAVEVGDLGEELGGLAQASGEEQDQGAGVVERFEHAEQGDGGRFAGLATAVEKKATVLAVDDLDLPRVGVEIEEAEDFVSGWSGHREICQWPANSASRKEPCEM